MTAPPLWTQTDAEAATGGRARSTWRATGVSIDSRTLKAGDLFVAIEGPNFDGHAFAADALARGAAACVVSRVPDGLAADAPLLVVEDTLAALRGLGRAARARCRGRFAAITGSVGKTGVKEALRTVLRRQGETAGNDGSLNNHWGVPLSLARTPMSAAFGVFEIGMNHVGELAPLSQMVRPHVAVITTVEAVHIENFPSEEAIADAKGEIFTGLEPGGGAVLYRDNRHFARLVEVAGRSACARIVTFGTHPAADVRLVSAELGSDGSGVRAEVLGAPIAYRLTIPGRHWVINSLCVLATVAAAKADVVATAAALEEVALAKGRGQRFRIHLGDGDFELIDDSYNASPVSMAAALDVLSGRAPGAGGRRIAALGDMLELGVEAPARHRALAAALRSRGIDLAFAAGPLMAEMFDELPPSMRGGCAADSAALAPMVAGAIRPGDVVAVKGSAGSKMGKVADALRALAVRPAEGGR